MLLLHCWQTLEDCRVACSSSSRWYALAAGKESTDGNHSLSSRPYYLSSHLSYPSLDYCQLCRLCHLCHISLQWAELLERAHSLCWLQLPFRRAWWQSHWAWWSSWGFCPSWAPGSLSTRLSLGFREGGRRCALAQTSCRFSLHSPCGHQCRWSLAQRRDCNPRVSDRSVMLICRYLRSPVAWCSKRLQSSGRCRAWTLTCGLILVFPKVSSHPPGPYIPLVSSVPCRVG